MSADMPPPLVVAVDRDEGRSARITLQGELDLISCDEFRAVLEDVAGMGEVVVDLRRLDFMDSTGIRCLLDTHHEMARRGGRLVVVEGDAVAHVLDVTGVRPILNFAG